MTRRTPPFSGPLYRVDLEPFYHGELARVYLSRRDGRTYGGYRGVKCITFLGGRAEDEAVEFASELEERIVNELPITEVLEEDKP